MQVFKSRFTIPAFLFFISVASTFYLAKWLIPQFLIIGYLVGFLIIHWKKVLFSREKAMVGLVVSFPLYALSAWAVTDNLTLALLLGTLWGISTSLGIHVILTGRSDDN
ncbi:hypothetical protein [Thermococcus sp. MV11]|uniref:hypothetical protein n=1 Tax=Thermococcus sp. MV11 TaxID=1638267 RepID=UPI0014309E6A|nr:hypothetical protein [Thermococcus sp. MV11]NJE04548.1 hypothetical protein [Thermococcus sp. MV11]